MIVDIKGKAFKKLQKLPKADKERIEARIEHISTLDHPSDISNDGPLTGTTNRYKIRQGNYRIVYKIESDKGILITAIDHRKDIYNKLFGISFGF
ncbi:MAG: type II toxin-antitoxin system RelE/ParE family toxin [Bacteroidota bacterium]